ncbi:hypothetical protein TRVL_05175 [Trypanosoma vivax]|nr:hypothetical protein TRVL_05175 [Trypanosoma vivax]
MNDGLTARESSRRSFRVGSPWGYLMTCLSFFEESTRPIESERRFGRRAKLCFVDRLFLQPGTFNSHNVAIPRTGVMSLTWRHDDKSGFTGPGDSPSTTRQ